MLFYPQLTPTEDGYMKYFNKPTVGSRLIDSPELIVNDKERLQSLVESHRVMKKDKVLGSLFSPLTGSRIRDLVQKTKESNAIL